MLPVIGHLTDSPDEQPLQQPYRDVGVSPMTQVTLPSILKRAVRDIVLNNPSVYDYYAARTSRLDLEPESAVPVSSMFEPVSQKCSDFTSTSMSKRLV